MAHPNDLENRRPSVALIVFGVLVTAAGITACVLPYQIRKYDYGRTWINVWWFGSGYIIVGIVACVAGATNTRAAHITNIVLSVLVLIGNGVWSIGLLAVSNAVDTACGVEKLNMRLNGFECYEDFEYGFLYGLAAVCCIGWVMVLCIHIIHDTKVCCVATMSGVVIHHVPAPTTVITTSAQPMMLQPTTQNTTVSTVVPAQSAAFPNTQCVAVAPPAYTNETAMKS